MWQCRKCRKPYAEALKICRACGGIVDELADSVADDSTQPTAEAAATIVIPSAADSDADEPASESDFDGADWRCSSCGEVVPGNFDVCWKCLTTRSGERTADVPIPAPEIDEVGDEASPAASREEVNVDTRARIRRPRCESCGSPEIVPDVTIMRENDSANGAWHVRAAADPAALPVKGFVFGEVAAVVCGECGHIGLRLVNPGQFYGLVKKQQVDSTSANSAANARLETTTCGSCGMLMEKGTVQCPHCGVVDDRDF